MLKSQARKRSRPNSTASRILEIAQATAVPAQDSNVERLNTPTKIRDKTTYKTYLESRVVRRHAPEFCLLESLLFPRGRQTRLEYCTGATNDSAY